MHRLYMWIKHQLLQWQINKAWSAALHEDWERTWMCNHRIEEDIDWFYKTNGNW
jgi:hypothetical protein